MKMIDFTSALYLGLQHPSWALRPWNQLTTGMPAALATPSRSSRVAQELAELQGTERATLSPSTLHLFWDLFGLWGCERVAIYLDGGCYPIAQWGAERAKGLGVRVQRFSHHDGGALRRLLGSDAGLHVKPIVVADGFCPRCGKSAPLGRYLESVREFGGYLILDDTQALGVIGKDPSAAVPYGRGGGGSLSWHGVCGPDIVLISSLAKGFGVPGAALSGSRRLVDWFEEKSETRVHCSPPSLAVVSALEHALAVNEKQGCTLRSRLAQRVGHFLSRLRKIGLCATGGLFPVQTLRPSPGTNPIVLHQKLIDRGIRTVLQRRRDGQGPLLSFLITVLHSLSDIERAVDALAAVMRNVHINVRASEVRYEIQAY